MYKTFILNYSWHILIFILLLIVALIIILIRNKKRIFNYKLDVQKSYGNLIKKLKKDYIFFSKLINNYNGIIYRIDIRGKYKLTFITPNSFKLTGYKPDEFKNLSDYLNLIHRDDREYANEQRQLADKDKTSFSITYRILTKTKQIKWVQEDGLFIFDDDNNPIAIEGFIHDITKAKENELSLIKQTDIFNQAQKIGKIGSWELNLETNINYVSDETLKIYGFNHNSNFLPFEKYNNAIIDEDKPRKFASFKAFINGTENYDIKFRIKRANDNEIVYIRSIANLEYDKNKKPVKVTGIIQDITEDVKNEEKLNVFQKGVDNAPSCFVITNSDEKIEYVNPQFTELTGYSSDEVLGKDFSILHSGTHSKDFYEKMWDTIKSGNIWHGELCNKKKNGDIYYESASISSIKNENNEITHYIAIKRDITNDKKVHKELIAAKEKAEEADKLKSAFLANMSHELRTPLNAILGFSQLINEVDITHEDRERFVKIIETNGGHLLSLIDSVIDMSMIESNQLKVFKKDCDIQSLLKDLYKKYEPEITEKNIDFILNTPQNYEKININTDESRLEQIISNLIDNAIKFTKKGKIEFGYKIETKNKITFYVKDSGIGIEKDKQKIIFENFRQIDNSFSRDFGGMGVGLSISKALVELLNGEIHVESEFGKGSTFYFILPCSVDVITQIDNETIAEKPETQTENKFKNKIILIAEDFEVNYLLIKEILNKFQVQSLWAENGKHAVEICEKNNDINAVLMDIKMPVMDGIEATKQIRKFRKDLPIIAQTAYVQTEEINKILNAGCNDYISKPINALELISTVGKHL